MKLGNFLSHDPDYPGVGLARGNKLEKAVWKDFSGDPQKLRAIARSIADGIPEAASENAVEAEDEFSEGQILTRLHQARERNRRAVVMKKKEVLQETGSLACEVCGFDFESTYGAIGKGYAECHHLLPFTELPNSKTTKLKDLAILCSNCHRMIHRARPQMPIKEFRHFLVLNQFKHSENCEN